MRRTSTVVFAVAAALALGACSSGTPDLTATTHSPSPTPTATASPTPSPSPSPSPSPADATPSASEPAAGNPCNTPGVTAQGLPAIDFNRYANICLGMSFAQASNAMPGPTVAGQPECPWYAEVLSVDDPGLYVAAVTYPDNPGGEIFLFRMIWMGDPAAAAAFDAPATQEGISVGSTRAAVTAAYPSATAVTVDDPSRGPRDQLVAAGPAGNSLVFDVTSGRVDTVYWGKRIATGAAGELCAL
ncbi:hypothetical protein [Demequina sp.]|uniref:hypothetical protein n=1 Tax=Demequina sp. TaxID=2050685 RepID=UPI0025BCFD9B|nr:hypothetical protein [Demequina sp.]